MSATSGAEQQNRHTDRPSPSSLARSLARPPARAASVEGTLKKLIRNDFPNSGRVRSSPEQYLDSWWSPVCLRPGTNPSLGRFHRMRAPLGSTQNPASAWDYGVIKSTLRGHERKRSRTVERCRSECRGKRVRLPHARKRIKILATSSYAPVKFPLRSGGLVCEPGNLLG